ncbi:50S ribosomal protein P1 [Candidatus Bathyarchaeota archaeon]|nr:50S ribosomal protein P1 [Candidatus Bathyarchaeota archaeon]
MKYIYAALLLHSSGKTVDAEGIKQVLKASNVEIDEARVKALVASLSEVDIDEAIKTSPGFAATQLVPATETPIVEEKKEKKEKEEKKEEEAVAGLGALFG